MDLQFLGHANRFTSDGGKQLLLRIKARDPQALSELYQKYGRLVFVVILRIVDNPGVAEDLVQETFLRVWNRAAALEEEYGSVGPWIVSIARHCALDYRRSGQAQLAAQTSIEPDDFPPVTIEHQLIDSEQARILADAFQWLSPRQRTVLELAYYEGLSQVAIAERLGQPLGTIKSWTRTALARLRVAIDRSQIHLA